MSLAAPIPPSPRRERRALGQGQPQDGISDWLHSASARRLPWDQLLPFLQGMGLCPCPPGVMEQVRAPAHPLGWEKVLVVVVVMVVVVEATPELLQEWWA